MIRIEISFNNIYKNREMTIFYTELARIYHEFYQSIFNYEEVFRFYNRELKKYGCKKILEIGCGTGNLSANFLKHDYNYTGLDVSEEMLEIAREVEADARYVQGDMRNLQLGEIYDAIIITGKSFAHLTENNNVINTLRSVRNYLKTSGVLILDCYDASVIFGNFRSKSDKEVVSEDKIIRRSSQSIMSLRSGWTWHWNSIYHVKINGETEQYRHSSYLRAFTTDEISLFLQIHGFDVADIEHKNSSFTVVTTC